MSDRLLAVETGGTKIVGRVLEADGRIVGEFRFPTMTPEAFLDQLSAEVGALLERRSLAGIAIAAFGPLDLDRLSPTYGTVLDTPKPGWRGFNLVQALTERFGAPVSLDTDVNAAALAEQALGAGEGLDAVAYVTVGTGIGVGLAINGQTLRGGQHPELGHLRMRRLHGDDHPSTCPFHGDCVEGLAAGPALRRRLVGRVLTAAPDVADRLVAYLGQLCAVIVLAWSPQRIVLGGGVMADAGLAPRVAKAILAELGGYGVARHAAQDGYVVRAALAHAGLEGATLMAVRSRG